MMKKNIIAILFVTLSGITFAQNAKVTTASNYLRQGDYIKAKEAIDAAELNVKTQGKPKTLVYKGKIYLAISLDTTDATTEFRKDAIFVSSESFSQARKVADSRTDTREIRSLLNVNVYNKMYSNGIEHSQNKEFAEASRHFIGCANIRAQYKQMDTIAYFYAANFSSAANLSDSAIKYYEKLKDVGEIRGTNIKEGDIYSRIANQYKAAGDTVKAIETIGLGRVAYPDNQGLLISEFNIYVEQGETEKAIANIDKAIEANPENAVYLDVRGKLKQGMNDIDGAEKDYLASLAVDPEQLAANYDLGALYITQSKPIVDEINNLPLSATKEYDAKSAELSALYEKALPYLEKAYLMEPNNKEIQNILIKLYLKTKQMDKYQKLMDESKTE